MGELVTEKHVKYILSVEKVCFPFINSSHKERKKILLSGCIMGDLLTLLLCFLFSYSFSGFQRKDNFESVVMEHLRMNGAYWGLTALDILGKLNTVDVDEVVPWMMSCQHESGCSL